MNCDRVNCTNEAKWNVVFVLRPPAEYRNAEPARATIALALCDQCKDQTAVEDLISDEGWKSIEDAFRDARRVIPDRSRTTLEFSPIHE